MKPYKKFVIEKITQFNKPGSVGLVRYEAERRTPRVLYNPDGIFSVEVRRGYDIVKIEVEGFDDEVTKQMLMKIVDDYTNKKLLPALDYKPCFNICVTFSQATWDRPNN
jgi:hypothetical protein